MPNLIVAPAARADIQAQWDYFADNLGRPDLADRFLVRAEITFDKLTTSPGLGRARRFANARLQNLRSWKIGGFPNHLVFYKPLPNDDGVEIIRVLHGARDLENLFRDSSSP
jgi:toxin ParE1/3/4